MRWCASFAIAFGLVTGVIWAGPTQSITVATPSVAISADFGQGQASVVLIVPGGLGVPRFDYTNAVSAGGETIPKDRISVTVTTREHEIPLAPRLVTLNVAATLPEGTPVNIPFSGSIILFDTPTSVSIPFSIIRHASTGMQVTPSSLTVVRGVADRNARSIQIMNTGQAPLSNVRISSSGFTSTDGKYEPAQATDTFTLSQGQTSKDVNLPWPRLAGVYSGTLDVTADGGLKQSIATTITTRGPYARCRVPIVLFFAILLAGYLLSLALENSWSDAAVERLETEIALRRDRAALAGTVGLLQRLVPAMQQKAGALFARLNTAWRQVNAIISDLDQLPSTSLAATVADMARVGANARTLQRYIEEAISLGSDDTLAKFLESAGEVDLKFDPTEYANKLDTILAGTTGVERGASITAPPNRTDDDIAGQLGRVRFFRNTFILVVVSLSAFLTIFLAKRDFGTAADYISLFFWSLGLTQAGAQILSKARSAWTK